MVVSSGSGASVGRLLTTKVATVAAKRPVSDGLSGYRRKEYGEIATYKDEYGIRVAFPSLQSIPVVFLRIRDEQRPKLVLRVGKVRFCESFSDGSPVGRGHSLEARGARTHLQELMSFDKHIRSLRGCSDLGG